MRGCQWGVYGLICMYMMTGKLKHNQDFKINNNVYNYPKNVLLTQLNFSSQVFMFPPSKTVVLIMAEFSLLNINVMLYIRH